MKMKNCIISAITCMALTLSLVGCGGAATGGSTDAKDASAQNGLKIAILTSPSGVDDGSFNQDNYNGILSFIEENPGSEVTNVRESTGDTAACVKALEDVVADYDVFVCDGFQFAGISEVAKDNPDKKFILVDTAPSDADGNEIEVDNIYSMTFKEQEGGFFSGMAAALTSTTKKVAVVNGIAFPTNVSYQYGFMSGVNYCNKHYGTDVEIV